MKAAVFLVLCMGGCVQEINELPVDAKPAPLIVELKPEPATIAKSAFTKPTLQGVSMQVSECSNWHFMTICLRNAGEKPAYAYFDREAFNFEIDSVPMKVWRKEPWIEVKRGDKPTVFEVREIEGHGSATFDIYFPIRYDLNQGVYTGSIQINDLWLTKHAIELGWKRIPSVGVTEKIRVLIRVDEKGKVSGRPIK
jgi:hypothetical protein